MNFFKKLFGARSVASLAAAATLSAQNTTQPDPAKDPNMIRVFDAYGREMFITKETWRKDVLPGVLKKEAADPERLCAVVVQALRDGFAADVVDAARQLQRIDPNAERGTAILANVYLQTKRIDEADALLSTFVKKHGETGLIVTNIAKVHSARGETAQADSALWHALELDPNQDNALLWFAALARERTGETGWLDALHRVAALPASWRAKLWLARADLEKKDLDGAVALYRQVLEQTEPVPADVLMQISGDLGNNGHLLPIVDLVAPRFRPAEHGIAVGNNLIKALVDLGRLEPARDLVQQLYAQNRMDWKQTLSFWDTEIAKAQAAATPVDASQKISMSMLNGEGPVWLPAQSPANELFPAPTGELVRVAFLGSTAETADMGDKIRAQYTDGPGRISRALPLFLAEQVRFGAHSSVRTLVPWLTSPHKGFVLAGVPWPDGDAATYARQNQPACDYVVVTHLKAATEPWHVDLRLVRTIDGKCLGTADASFPSTQPQAGLPILATQLLKLLASQADATLTPTPGYYQVPNGGDFMLYLVRLEQLLAVRCGGIEGPKADFLSGERDIVDGNLQLCLSQPKNPAVRILLLQTCLALKTTHPTIVAEYREKLDLLQREHPLAEPANGITQRLLASIVAP